jgi:dihydrofolate synthase/folylpolyglutamate synthase
MNRITKLSSFKDVELALRPFVPLVSELTGKDTVLDRIVPLMKILGNPEDKLRTIHIAGTSGKTSTSYYISSLLCQSGLMIGLSVSPNIDKLSERTQINGKPIDDQTFFKELGLFLDIVESCGIRPSYFELIYAFSIWLFAKLGVDYAVIETGVGGLFDATNVVTREDKVCVITDIGFDHMHLLGDTIPKITAQKVGIVHDRNALLMYQQSSEVMNVVSDWVGKHDANLQLVHQDDEMKYGDDESFYNLPNFQKRNWLLAYKVYRFVADRDDLPELNLKQIATTQEIKIPARMDTIKIDNKLLVMDGAHNQQKMSAFIASFKAKYPGVKPAVLLAFKTGKDYLNVLESISDFADQVIVTTFKTSQDLPVTSIDPNIVARGFLEVGATDVTTEPDKHKAYKLLLQSPNEYLVVTGSFYLIAQLREVDIKHD